MLMENVTDSSGGKRKEGKTKGARGMSLRACVAKAVGLLRRPTLPQAKRLTLIKHRDLK
jgi:hypothetical protein